jgi:hypothetical protein
MLSTQPNKALKHLADNNVGVEIILFLRLIVITVNLGSSFNQAFLE